MASLFATGVKVWLPGQLYEKSSEDLIPWANRSLFQDGLIARLAPGHSVKSARSELHVRLVQLNTIYTPTTHVRYGEMVGVQPLRELLVRDLRLVTWTLWIGAACVLLIATSNGITILLGLVAQRRHEIAVRRSLGASEWNLIRSFGIEALGLAAMAGLGGLAASWMLLSLLPSVLAVSFDTMLNRPSLGPRVFGFSLAVSLAVAILAIAPAVRQVLQTDTFDELREERGNAGRSNVVLRRLLISVQTAIAVIVMISAGLTLRTQWNLSRVRLGFQPKQVLFARIPPTGWLAESDSSLRAIGELLDQFVFRLLSTKRLWHRGCRWWKTPAGPSCLLRDPGSQCRSIIEPYPVGISPLWAYG
jgi:hypothetical protein